MILPIRTQHAGKDLHSPCAFLPDTLPVPPQTSPILAKGTTIPLHVVPEALLCSMNEYPQRADRALPLMGTNLRQPRVQTHLPSGQEQRPGISFIFLSGWERDGWPNNVQAQTYLIGGA